MNARNLDRTPRTPPRPSQRRRSRGVAAVELAFTMVPMLILTFGVTEYGRAIYTYNTLEKATRDATRHLTSVVATNPDPKGEARRLVMHGNVEGTGPLLAPDLEASMVVIEDAASSPGTHTISTGTGTINLVTVRIVGYRYRSIVTYVAPATIDFGAISVTMRSHL
jgi:Flp pilus assembly protein TadG